MECLREAGEKLGKYELEKRHAIEMEDYERARHKKNQIDEFRTYVYHNLAVEQLLEENGVSTIYEFLLNTISFMIYNVINLDLPSAILLGLFKK